jgi:hypothetical protein
VLFEMSICSTSSKKVICVFARKVSDRENYFEMNGDSRRRDDANLTLQSNVLLNRCRYQQVRFADFDLLKIAS